MAAHCDLGLPVRGTQTGALAGEVSGFSKAPMDRWALGGSARAGVNVAEMNGAGPDAMNSFEHPEAVGVRDQRTHLGGLTFECDFPAHSVTVIRLDMA